MKKPLDNAGLVRDCRLLAQLELLRVVRDLSLEDRVAGQFVSFGIMRLGVKIQMDRCPR